MHGGSTEKWGRRTITAHWKWDRSKAEGCVHLMGDLGIPRQWRLAKAEPNEGRRAALCAAATGDAAVKAATAARLSLFLCFYTAEVAAAARRYTTAKPCGGDGAAPRRCWGCRMPIGFWSFSLKTNFEKKITFELTLARGDFVIWSNIVKSLSSNQKDAVLIWLKKISLFEKLHCWELQLHFKLEKTDIK